MKYAVIYNPNARNSKKLSIERIVEIMKEKGVGSLIYKTTRRGEAIELAAQAVSEGASRIYPAGGDGTLNEVVSGLMKLSCEKPGLDLPVVCPIPLGTVNVFSKETGFPEDPEKAFLSSFSAREEAIDIGQCNDRFFILMTSAGFDGFIINELEKMIANKSNIKKFTGPFAYVIIGFQTLFTYAFPKLKISACSVFGKKEFTGDFVVISNSKFYGGKFILNPAVKMNDGFLDVLIFNSRSRFEFLKFFYMVMTKKTVFKGLDVKCVPVKTCDIEYLSKDGGCTYSQIDGELYEQPPLKIKTHEHALKILSCI